MSKELIEKKIQGIKEGEALAMKQRLTDYLGDLLDKGELTDYVQYLRSEIERMARFEIYYNKIVKRAKQQYQEKKVAHEK